MKVQQVGVGLPMRSVGSAHWGIHPGRTDLPLKAFSVWALLLCYSIASTVAVLL